MTEQRFGKVIGRGSDAFVALVGRAVADCVKVNNPRLEDRLPRDFRVEEHSKAEFVAAGYVFADGSLNEGRVAQVKPITILWVRSDIAKNKPGRAKHIVRHEIFHPFPLSDAKKLELLPLMWTAGGKHPTAWKGSYKERPEECHADTCAEAASGLDSPWDNFDFFKLDVKESDHPKFLEITLRADPTPVVEPPPPAPLPPQDPALLEAQARVAELNATLAGIAADLRPVLAKAEGTGGG